MKNRNFHITTHELAKICNVSQGTVDRALNGREGIKPETKQKILETAKQYGYIKNNDIKPQLIGIVLFDLYNDYFAQLIMDFEKECKQAGYSLVVMFTDKDCEREKRCIMQLYYMGVSGIVLCPINDGEEFKNFLNAIKIPIVTVGNKIDGVCYIGIDNFKAMYDATVYLGEKYKSIVYYCPSINSPDNSFAQRERFRGFTAAAEKLNIKTKTATDITHIETLKKSTDNFAVMCSTDYYLAKVISHFPDICTMGFDNIYSRKIHSKKIPSVDSNITEVAKKALQNIQDNCNKNYIVDYKIIKGVNH